MGAAQGGFKGFKWPPTRELKRSRIESPGICIEFYKCLYRYTIDEALDFWTINSSCPSSSTVQKHGFLAKQLTSVRNAPTFQHFGSTERCSLSQIMSQRRRKGKKVGEENPGWWVFVLRPEWCHRNQRAECQNSAQEIVVKRTRKLEFFKVTMFFTPWWITHLGNVFLFFQKRTDTRTLDQIFQNVNLPANSQLVHFKLQNTSPAARASTMVLASLVGVYVEDRILDVFWCFYVPCRYLQFLCLFIRWRFTCCHVKSPLNRHVFKFVFQVSQASLSDVILEVNRHLKNGGPVLVMVKPFLKNRVRKPTYNKWGADFQGKPIIPVEILKERGFQSATTSEMVVASIRSVIIPLAGFAVCFFLGGV